MKKNNMRCTMLVLKVASLCNLNCSYCYVYNLGDTTYLDQPKVMSKSTIKALLKQIKKHCITHDMKEFTFIFHGGEPLLAGKEFYSYFVKEAKKCLLPNIDPIFSMQTNGVLITEEWCKTLGALNIHFGISIDGPKKVNDKYRVDHKGRGSYDKIIKGYNIAQNSKYTKIKPGLLSVMNIDADPIETYSHLKSLNPRSVDFLFLEANFDNRPEGKKTDLKKTPYADWMIEIFNLWFHDKEKPFKIRLFETYMLAIFGLSFGLDTVGNSKNEILVIEADGGIEPVGSLKVCGHGFTKVGANVHTHTLDDALQTKLATLYHNSGKNLCSTCKKCPIKEVCGAGYLPHRYSKINGFDNPSVYCSDLMKLITHIQNQLYESFPKKIRRKIPIEPLTFRQLKEYMKPYVDLHHTSKTKKLNYSNNWNDKKKAVYI